MIHVDTAAMRVIGADGVVAVGGITNDDIGLAVARYDAYGRPDSTFGTGGIVTYSISDATGTMNGLFHVSQVAST